MDMDVRGSHGYACGVDTWFPWMAYERLMDEVLNNCVMQGSHGHGRAVFPWICVRG